MFKNNPSGLQQCKGPCRFRPGRVVPGSLRLVHAIVTGGRVQDGRVQECPGRPCPGRPCPGRPCPGVSRNVQDGRVQECPGRPCPGRPCPGRPCPGVSRSVQGGRVQECPGRPCPGRPAIKAASAAFNPGCELLTWLGRVATTVHACGGGTSSVLAVECYTEKARNTWQRRGTQNTTNTHNQPNRPNRQTSQTKHQALPKGQPGRRITPINTTAVHASAQQLS